MNIGDTVTYIRHNKDGISEGTARLKGMGLDGEGRLIVLLKDGANSFNTYLNCANPSPEFCQQFRELIVMTEALSKEGREKQEAIVQEYNGKIATLDDELLGKAMEF